VFENVRISVLAQQGKTFKLFTLSRNLVNKETSEILESVGLIGKRRVSAAPFHGDRKVLEMAIALEAGRNSSFWMSRQPACPRKRQRDAST
jgi:ABC-type uncharacterized transport system ATPase subunit